MGKHKQVGAAIQTHMQREGRQKSKLLTLGGGGRRHSTETRDPQFDVTDGLSKGVKGE